MLDKETLQFKVGLSRSSAKKQPEFAIYINDKELVKSTVSLDPGATEFFEFEAEVPEGDCFLVIQLLNKSNEDTVQGTDNEIIEDLLLNIESVEVDDIELGNLIWTLSDYRPDYSPEYINYCANNNIALAESIKNCVNLGWNGRWVLKFQSPFYIWLLENI